MLKTNSQKEMIAFRSLLLNRCQKEFEKDTADALDMERRMKEIEEAETVGNQLSVMANLSLKQPI